MNMMKSIKLLILLVSAMFITGSCSFPEAEETYWFQIDCGVLNENGSDFSELQQIYDKQYKGNMFISQTAALSQWNDMIAQMDKASYNAVGSDCFTVVLTNWKSKGSSATVEKTIAEKKYGLSE